uniref:Uncharacterized protein n=1 Tax=Trichogramma kaykai TaxID=54128 RepID=A0ABD2W102_9HYME
MQIDNESMDYLNQQKIKRLKRLRKKVNWEMEKERHELLDRLYPLIENWEGHYANFLDIFRRPEIHRLLMDSIDYWGKDESDDKLIEFITFVIRTGFEDEPVIDEEGKPLLHRTTAVHVAARRRMSSRMDNQEDQLDMVIDRLFLIYNKFNVNYIDERGMSHFHVACLSGCESVVEKFLELGQDPNFLWRETGYSPLELALGKWTSNIWSHKDIFQSLLENGANPNVTNRKGQIPLHIIITEIRPRNRRKHFMEMIFEFCQDKYRPVQVNARNQQGSTPLHLAMKGQKNVAIELLLKNGADPNAVDNDGYTPLHTACFLFNHVSSLKLFFEINDELQQTVQVNAVDNRGRTPLQLAVERGLPDVVDIFLDFGSDLSNFVFPFHTYFNDVRRRSCIFKIVLTSSILVIAESLERRGYNLNRSDALMIMKLFAHYGLLEKSANLDRSLHPAKYWYDDENFTSIANEIKVNPSLSLYDLVLLQPEQAAKQLTLKDYYEWSRWGELNDLLEMHREACTVNLCEKLSRKFFRRWALDPFLELTHYRLPILCCDMIIENLGNEDLYNICLAAKSQNKRKKVTKTKAKISNTKRQKTCSG